MGYPRNTPKHSRYLALLQFYGIWKPPQRYHTTYATSSCDKHYTTFTSSSFRALGIPAAPPNHSGLRFFLQVRVINLRKRSAIISVVNEANKQIPLKISKLTTVKIRYTMLKKWDMGYQNKKWHIVFANKKDLGFPLTKSVHS